MQGNGVLYSVNTSLAFRIQRTYYNNTHFVWCTDKFDHGASQPASSNPASIAMKLFRDVYTRDGHSAIIEQNRNGIKRGAMLKRKTGIIDEYTEAKIIKQVNAAAFEDFLPLLYVIPYSKVKSICAPAPDEEKAALHSHEYTITDLPRAAFDLIVLSHAFPLDLIGDERIL